MLQDYYNVKVFHVWIFKVIKLLHNNLLMKYWQKCKILQLYICKIMNLIKKFLIIGKL